MKVTGSEQTESHDLASSPENAPSQPLRSSRISARAAADNGRHLTEEEIEAAEEEALAWARRANSC